MLSSLRSIARPSGVRIVFAGANPAALAMPGFRAFHTSVARFEEFTADELARNPQLKNKEVAEMYHELQSRRARSKKINAPADPSNPQVFFNLSIDGKEAGQVVMEVHKQHAPKAADNFRALCTGEKGGKLTYKGSKFYTWLNNCYLKGGDIINNNGTGGESIYGPSFKGEMSEAPMGYGSVHLVTPDLSTPDAVYGRRDIVDSRFAIMTMDLPSIMTGLAVCVGQVIKGMEIIDDIQNIDTDEARKPTVDVVISDCGELPESERITKEHAREN